MNLIYNSSGKVIGVSYIDKNKIIIDHYNKPLYKITNKDTIEKVLNKLDEGIIELFDKYFLLISEIASLYNTHYFTINRKINKFKEEGLIRTNNKNGRRNPSFSKTFDEERRRHIGEAGKGKHSHCRPYEMTAEIKAKISHTLQEGFSSGRIKMNKEALSKAWADGRYENVPMGRGIQGFFESKKHTKSKDVYFRSLLELKFLIEIEENDSIKSFTWEPFCIPLGDKQHYTPDCLIDNTLVELKPRDHLKYTKDNINNRFEKEVEAANKFCNERGYIFKIVYDDELNFNSKKFKKFLIDTPEIIDKYNIRFKKELKKD